MPLEACKREIQEEFSQAGGHANIMKLAVIGSFLLDAVTEQLKGIDSEKFLVSLRDNLKQKLALTDEWKEKSVSMNEHLEKNKELLTAFDEATTREQKLSEEITGLLKEYDEMLRKLSLERSRKSIAEIESELKGK